MKGGASGVQLHLASASGAFGFQVEDVDNKESVVSASRESQNPKGLNMTNSIATTNRESAISQTMDTQPVAVVEEGKALGEEDDYHLKVAVMPGKGEERSEIG
jgi:hypothetical protein